MRWSGWRAPSMSWEGDPDSRLYLEGFREAVCERIADGMWHCRVTMPEQDVVLFDSAEAGLLPLSADSAMRLCELVIADEVGRDWDD